MADVKSSNSGSDTSTDSWTFIDENQPDPDLPALLPELPGAPIILLEEPPRDDPPKKTRSNGFLTFDEYLQERLVEHDYEQDAKIEELKTVQAMPREVRKCKAKNIGTIAFVGLLLALSGFATLCSTLAVPYYASEVYMEPPVEVMEAPAPAPPSISPIIFVQPEKLKIAEIVEHSHPPLEDVNMTSSEEDTCYEEPEQKIIEDVNKFEDQPKLPDDLRNTSSFEELYRNHVHKRLRLLKRVLYNSNLHTLLSFVMINVYLITLIATLYKQQMFTSLSKLGNETSVMNLTAEEEAEARESILKQLPFWGQELEKSLGKPLPAAKRNKLAKLRRIQRQKRYDSRDFKEQILESLNLLTKVIKPHDEHKTEEPNVKAKKCSVGQIQRDRVKLLKAKFSNEMSQIRERQMEEAAKADAMHMTNQKFMMKLKNNRDKYLLELRRLKETRQAREQSKDASVGSYAVAMPPGYSFVEKLRILQARENEKEREKEKARAAVKTRMN